MERQVPVPEAQFNEIVREAQSLLGGGTDWDARVCTLLERVVALGDPPPPVAQPGRRIARQPKPGVDRDV